LIPRFRDDLIDARIRFSRGMNELFAVRSRLAPGAFHRKGWAKGGRSGSMASGELE